MVKQLTPLLSCALLATATMTTTTAAHADGYCGSKDTVFYCKTTNKKQIKVCKKGSKYTYQYGRVGKKPELTLKRDMMVDKLHYMPWNGVGNDITQTLAFETGATTYAVYSVNQRMGLGETTGGVLVERYGQTLAHVHCYPNTLVDNLCNKNCGLRYEMNQ